MSVLVGNPEDRFSHNETQFFFSLECSLLQNDLTNHNILSRYQDFMAKPLDYEMQVMVA